MRTLSTAGFALMALLALHVALARADVPQRINYQGYMTNSAAAPVNASVPVVFRLYTDSAGGTALWSESQTVAVTNGIYNVVLGSVTPLTIAFGTQYYLGVSVGTDAEMSPRQALASAPYALRAGCNPGDRIACYTAATGTPGVGLCQTGTRVCNAQGTGWSACSGEVTPNCGSSCVNLQTDRNNCGTCGHVCPGAQNCVAGVCQ